MIILELTREEAEYLLSGIECDTEPYRAKMLDQLETKLKSALEKGE